MKDNNNNISSESRFTMPRVKSLYIDPNNIDFDSFSNMILSKLTSNITYSAIFKVKYNGTYFGMLGHQEGIRISSIYDKNSIHKLFDNLNKSIEEFYDEYSVEYLDIIQMIYVTIKDIPELKLKNINNIKLNKEFVNVQHQRYGFSSKILPLTTNLSYYGELLVGDVRLSYLQKINEEKNLLHHKQVISEEITNMFLYNRYIIINFNLTDSIIRREIFYAETGKYKGTFVDTIQGMDSFSRSKDFMVIYIKDNKVINLNAFKELPIIKYTAKAYKGSVNPLIGSIDLEAFKDNDDHVKIYAIGYVGLKEEPRTFYLNENFDSSSLLLQCFDEILTKKYDGYTFYTHNFGGYDSAFILKILKEFNNVKGYDYYKLNPRYRDNRLLSLGIMVRKELSNRKQSEASVKKEPGWIKISIVDSYTLLSNNLYDLSISFGLKITKGHFPHSFVSRDTINYVGNTPSINYWENRLNKKHKELYDKNDWGGITVKEYMKLFSKTWNLKDECIKYLNRDLTSLLNIMNTFNNYVFRNYDLQMTECSTISRLALSIFLKDYLKDSKLPIIRSNMYKDIKQAYFGGVTEVYRPYGENLYYYNVNSLYPYSSLNYIPGKSCNYIESFDVKGLELNKLFGFFYCEVETNDSYLGLLPVRRKEGIIMPNGKWSGWYLSEELKFAFENGYDLKVIKGYKFEKTFGVFNKYINEFYRLKSVTTDEVERQMAKSLLNNLLGRFGMNIDKSITELVDDKRYNELTQYKQIKSVKHIGNKKLVTHSSNISLNICESHDVDFTKTFNNDIKHNKNKGFSEERLHDVSIAISSAITSYSRVYMSKLKLDILKTGSIYYTDTDSIVTDIKLEDKYVGNEIGKLKLEHTIKEGYFISNKTYCFKTLGGKTIIRTKGLDSKSLCYEDFVKLYNGTEVEGIKIVSLRNFSEGYVNILIDKKIIISPYSYLKRDKIYKNGLWTDTKPLILT